MSRRLREKSYKPETKKEFIIRVAKEDPFLKIEEIAEQAKTTQRYVRTILSEANLSLMNLREEYARKMEKQSEAKILFSIKDSVFQLDFPIDQETAPFTYGTPQLVPFEWTEKCTWHSGRDSLYQYMQVVSCHGQTCGYIFHIRRSEFAGADLHHTEEGLFQRLGIDQPNARLTSPELEIGRLSELLHNTEISSTFGADRSIVKIKTLIKDQNQTLGEEIFIFPSDFIKVTIPGLFNPVLQLAR